MWINSLRNLQKLWFHFAKQDNKEIPNDEVGTGGRLRLIVQDSECVKLILSMPDLPVAHALWQVKSYK